MKKKFYLIAGVALMLGFSACKKDNEFNISGMVEGGAEKMVVLEKPDYHGRWVALDSTAVGKDGGFAISAARPSAPEIYRLALDGKYIYLPVDSTESLTVNTKAAAFGQDFTVSGSNQAEMMSKFEKELMSLDFNDESKRENFKRSVYSNYMKDAQGGIISYYVLTKTVGDKPLFDIENPSDAKYYAAVATSYEQYRPDDPHSMLLRQASLEAMKRKNSAAGRKRVMEAEEIKMLDITLPDETGKEVKLSDVMSQGKKGVMVVTMMNEKESPVVNKALSDIYNKGGIAIYMVSLDEDLYAWRKAASNLPWITVADPGSRNSEVVTKYNVTGMPAFFIFDGEGELIDRAFSLEELNKKL